MRADARYARHAYSRARDAQRFRHAAATRCRKDAEATRRRHAIRAGVYRCHASEDGDVRRKRPPPRAGSQAAEQDL